MSAKTTERGLGSLHQSLRRSWATIVRRGLAKCSRCGDPIAADGLWDLDHTEDRSGWLGAAHRSCNRRAGALKANSPRRASRAW